MGLKKAVGMTLTGASWIGVLFGLANLAVAAIRNREGELGQGLDATVAGAHICFLSFGLAAAGITFWVLGARDRPAREALATGIAVVRMRPVGVLAGVAARGPRPAVQSRTRAIDAHRHRHQKRAVPRVARLAS